MEGFSISVLIYVKEFCNVVCDCFGGRMKSDDVNAGE
jgi:hypothetical protein